MIDVFVPWCVTCEGDITIGFKDKRRKTLVFCCQSCNTFMEVRLEKAMKYPKGFTACSTRQPDDKSSVDTVSLSSQYRRTG
jgi:hypothetical protein